MKLDGLALVAELGSSVLKHNGRIRDVRVSPDGKRILSIGDGTDVHVWDAATGERVADLDGTDRGLSTLAISPDGRRVFAGGLQAQVFELGTKRHKALPVRTPRVGASAFAPDGTLILGDDRVPRRFDTRGFELPPLEGHGSRVDAIAVSRDGRRALTCGADARIKLHALADRSPEVLATWQGHGRSCGFSPDGSLVWAVGWNHAVVRGATTGRPLFVPAELAGIRTGAMSDDGARFAVAADDAIHVYALPGGRPLARIAYPGADKLAFTPDGRRLVAAPDGRGLGEGCGLVVFDVETEARVLPSDGGHLGGIEALAIAPAMPHALFSLGADGLVALWDLDAGPRGQVIERLGSVTGQGRVLACTADGTRLVTGTDRGELLAWDVARTEAARFEITSRASAAVAISPDGRHVAYAPVPGPVVVFELATRALVATLAVHRSQACAVAWLDAETVLSSAADETVVASRFVTRERLWTATCSGFVNAICVVGDVVLSGTTYGQIALWDARTGHAHGVLRASGREVRIACTVDHEHAAVIRRADDFESSIVELWSVARRAVVASADLTALGDQARAIVVSPDGRRLYVATNASRVLVFERS